MILRQSTKSLLNDIHALSGSTLQRQMDLGILIEISAQHSLEKQLNDLAFAAKFIVKSFELMKRIGKDGNGYDKISMEFSNQIKTSQSLLNSFLEKADAPTRAHFSGHYLAVNTVTMENLMALYHDLGWYKNYRIDRSSGL